MDQEKARILRWLHRNVPPTFGTNPEDMDLDAVERTVSRVGRLFGTGRYFPLEVRGWENLPAAPALLVSNHSGGTTVVDLWGLFVAWYRHFGRARPLRPMAHEMVLSNRATGAYFAQRGAIRASPGVALDVLRKCGHDVLVCPGGDLDTWRPYRARFTVRFGGRKGYARLALRARVPIVPIVNAGAHETLIVLTDGHRAARALRLHALARADVFPVHISLPWGLAIGPWPHIPWPARLRYRIGGVIEPEDCNGEPDEDQVDRLDQRVRTALQGLLDGLKADGTRRE